jgi:hypothetical protein
MGLNFYIQKYEALDVVFGYTEFMRFRYNILRLIGIDTGEDINIYKTGAAEKMDKNHPLFDFIWHCDCDGKLDSYQCAEMGPVLNNLLEKWAPDNEYDKRLRTDGVKLANAMIRCGDEDADLMFG